MSNPGTQLTSSGPGSTPKPRFTIVIPALNEEEAIGSTIERCLAVRDEIRNENGVDEVRLVVVSDGSTDRTVEIARSYDEIELLVFPENRGYGAAIKAGWDLGGGDLLGFLDADNTCDPKYFVPMCREILDNGQDVCPRLPFGAGLQDAADPEDREHALRHSPWPAFP